jgi:hypothetical protein
MQSLGQGSWYIARCRVHEIHWLVRLGSASGEGGVHVGKFPDWAEWQRAVCAEQHAPRRHPAEFGERTALCVSIALMF